MYIAMKSYDATLLISEEDLFLGKAAINHNINFIDFDKFLKEQIKEEG